MIDYAKIRRNAAKVGRDAYAIRHGRMLSWKDLQAATDAAISFYNAALGNVSEPLTPTPTAEKRETYVPETDLHAHCGADAREWAHQFAIYARMQGYSDMDEGWLIGWFANAIEASWTKRLGTLNESIKAATGPYAGGSISDVDTLLGAWERQRKSLVAHLSEKEYLTRDIKQANDMIAHLQSEHGRFGEPPAWEPKKLDDETFTVGRYAFEELCRRLASVEDRLAANVSNTVQAHKRIDRELATDQELVARIWKHIEALEAKADHSFMVFSFDDSQLETWANEGGAEPTAETPASDHVWGIGDVVQLKEGAQSAYGHLFTVSEQRYQLKGTFARPDYWAIELYPEHNGQGRFIVNSKHFVLVEASANRG